MHLSHVISHMMSHIISHMMSHEKREREGERLFQEFLESSKPEAPKGVEVLNRNSPPTHHKGRWGVQYCSPSCVFTQQVGYFLCYPL